MNNRLVLSSLVFSFCLNTYLSAQQIDDAELAKKLKTAGISKHEQKIEKALQEETRFDFVDTPLTDVLDYVSEAHDIPVCLHLTSIEDFGYDSELPFTNKSKNRSLRSALKSLFREYKIIFLIKDDELLITTQEYLDDNPDEFTTNRLYDVSKLVKEGDDSIPMGLKKSVDWQSWMDPHGGPGQLSIIKTSKKTVLSITHTSEHHFEIAKFLNDLRTINEKK